MCVDNTGLNKACPKDPFALPSIDQVIDSELLCFLDAYSGYHQIKTRKSNQLATSFTMPYDTFCYVTMPFGLKKKVLRTSGQCNIVYTIKLVGTFTPMWTI